MNTFRLRAAARAVRSGDIIAYPTEAVYGLGCDPWNRAAVYRLLALKRRPVHKGLILIAADVGQLAPFMAPLTASQWHILNATWPGPFTWLVPTHHNAPRWLSGRHPTIAVRVTAHPVAAALCRFYGGALVSTSANVSGRPPATNALAARRQWGHTAHIVPGTIGGSTTPTRICDVRTGHVVRP